MPKVSVVIPNYNHAKFLRKRIESVLGQTVTDIEVIFLDDASTDSSLEVFQEYVHDSRVRSIFNSSNSGSVFKQWNLGLHEARGEYVWIAESDDYADIRFLEVMLQRFERYPTAGIAWCQSMMVDPENNLLGAVDLSNWWEDGEKKPIEDYFIKGEDQCARNMIMLNAIPNASAVLMKKSALDKAGFADENLKIAGDWLFWVNMLLAADMVFVADPLNYWRHHRGTVRAATEKSGLCIIESYNVLRKIAGSVKIDPDTLEKSRSFWYQRWYWSTRENHFDLACNLRIYRSARAYDNRINSRIIREFLPLLRIRLGAIKAVLLHRIRLTLYLVKQPIWRVLSVIKQFLLGRSKKG